MDKVDKIIKVDKMENVALVIDDNNKLTNDRHYRKRFIKIVDNIIIKLLPKFKKIFIYFTNSPIIMLTKFDSNDTIDIYIKDIITGYQINDGISNISNTNIFDYIIVITTESSIINISESNIIFLKNKMYLLNLNFNKIGLIHYKNSINFYQYLEKIFNKKKL